MHEFPLDNEFSELRSKALDLLRRDREQGSVTSEAQQALADWMAAKERSIMEFGDVDKEANAESQIRLIIEQASLLGEAGLHQQAFDALDDAQTQARQQNRRDLFDAAGDMVDEINKR